LNHFSLTKRQWGGALGYYRLAFQAAPIPRVAPRKCPNSSASPEDSPSGRLVNVYLLVGFALFSPVQPLRAGDGPRSEKLLRLPHDRREILL